MPKARSAFEVWRAWERCPGGASEAAAMEDLRQRVGAKLGITPTEAWQEMLRLRRSGMTIVQVIDEMGSRIREKSSP